MQKLALTGLVLSLALAAPAASQQVPDWSVDDHGNTIEQTDLGDGRSVYETSLSIGGGRGGFGRALSRIANTAGVGGFSLTVRTEAHEGGPGSEVLLSVYLKDLHEKMPGASVVLDLGEGVRVPLRRDGAVREYGGDLREAEYRGRIAIGEYLGVASRNRIDGSFEGREFRIEKKQLDALRDLLLRVAPAGSTLETTIVQADGRSVSDSLLASHGLHVTEREAAGVSDPTAVALVIDFGPGTAAPVLLQPVLTRWSENADVADWTPLAAVGDTVHVFGDDVVAATVTRRYAVEEVERGSLCRSSRLDFQGWMYEVAPLDGPLARSTAVTSRLGAVRGAVADARLYSIYPSSDPVPGTVWLKDLPGYASMQTRAFAAIGERWGAAMRAARGEGGDRYDDPRPTTELLSPENLNVIVARGANGEELLVVSASLMETQHYLVPSTNILYVVGPDGKLVQELEGESLPEGTLSPAEGGADLLLTREGVATWNGAGWTFPTRSLPYAGCT